MLFEMKAGYDLLNLVGDMLVIMFPELKKVLTIFNIFTVGIEVSKLKYLILPSDSSTFTKQKESKKDEKAYFVKYFVEFGC
jgi:hypothetical protein